MQTHIWEKEIWFLFWRFWWRNLNGSVFFYLVPTPFTLLKLLGLQHTWLGLSGTCMHTDLCRLYQSSSMKALSGIPSVAKGRNQSSRLTYLGSVPLTLDRLSFFWNQTYSLLFKRYNLHRFWEGAGKEIAVLSLIMVEYKIALLSMQACGGAKWFLLAYRAIVCCSSPP